MKGEQEGVDVVGGERSAEEGDEYVQQWGGEGEGQDEGEEGGLEGTLASQILYVCIKSSETHYYLRAQVLRRLDGLLLLSWFVDRRWRLACGRQA